MGQVGVLLSGEGEQHFIVLFEHLKVSIVCLLAPTSRLKIPDIALFDLFNDTQETKLVTSWGFLFSLSLRRLLVLLAFDNRIFGAKITTTIRAFLALYRRIFVEMRLLLLINHLNFTVSTSTLFRSRLSRLHHLFLALILLTTTPFFGRVHQELLSRLPYLINLVLGGQFLSLGQRPHQIANGHLSEVTLTFEIDRAERQIGKIAHKIIFFDDFLRSCFILVLVLFVARGTVPYPFDSLEN